VFSRSGRWSRLRNDQTLFLICLLIALTFWLFVKLSDEYETELQISLKFECPPTLIFSSAPPAYGHALIKGSGWNLLSNYLKNRNHSVYINLSSQPSPGRVTVQLNEQSRLNLGGNFKVLALAPNSIELLLDSLERRKLPLHAPLQLQFFDGYHLKQPPLLEPDSVWVQGPATIVRELTSWETDTLKYNQLKSDHSATVAVRKPDNPTVEVDPARVDVSLQVEPVVEQSLFIPVKVLNAPNRYRVFPASIRLTFVVGMSRMGSIQASDFELTADVKDLVVSSDNTLVPLNLTRKPDAARGIRYSPQVVEVILQLKAD
jgi:hypothetical protein